MEQLVLAQRIVDFAQEHIALRGLAFGKLIGAGLRAGRTKGQGCAFGGQLTEVPGV